MRAFLEHNRTSMYVYVGLNESQLRPRRQPHREERTAQVADFEIRNMPMPFGAEVIGFFADEHWTPEGRARLRQAFDERGNLLPPGQWDDAFAASIASIEVVTREMPGARKGKRGARVEYIHKIKAWDKNSALEKIAKHLGMFVDRIEHSGPSGGPIQTESRTWREVLRQEGKD